MNPFSAFVETAARVAVATLLNSVWESALMALAVWAVLRYLPNINATTRYVAWSVALLACLVLPLATAIEQTSTVSSRTSQTHQVFTTIPNKPVRAHERAFAPGTAAPHATAVASAPAPFAFPSRLHFALPGRAAEVVFGLWFIAALAILGRLAFSLVQLELLKRDALPLSVGYRENMVRWASAAKGSREVRLCVSDRVQVPVAVGLFDSMILIPSHLLETLSQGEVDQITLHELAHLRRADDWTNGLQRIVQALFFFNPAVLWIAQQLDLEREVACDDWVLSHTGDVRPYAFCLTKMAEVTAWPHRALAAPGAFVTRKSLSIRVERLLRAGRNIGPTISPGSTGAVLAALGIVFFALRSVAPSFAFVLAPEAVPPPVLARVASPHPAPAPALAPPVTPSRKLRDRAHVQSVHERSIIEERIITIPARHVHVRARTIQVPPVNVDIPEQRIVLPRNPAVAPIPGPRFFDGRMFKQTFDQRFERKMQSMRKRLDEHFRFFPPVGLPKPAMDGRSCIGCDLQGVNWKDRKVAGGHYLGADFKNANLQNVDFSDGTFNGVDFRNADLRGADFRNTRLAGVDFRGAKLGGTRFDGARLAGIDLSGSGLAGIDDTQVRALLSNCAGCDLHAADLSGKDLHGISVAGSNFSESNERNARLNGAMLVGSDFRRADLRGADLSDATLCASQQRSPMATGDAGGISCVDLQGADLHGANLRGAQVCEWEHDNRSCHPVSAAMLRTRANANLDGASGI